MNTTSQVAVVLLSVGVGCLVGGLIAAFVAFFMGKTSAAKISQVINVASDQNEELRAEVIKLRQAIVSLTEAVDTVISTATYDRMDPDAAWNLSQMNRAAKAAAM